MVNKKNQKYNFNIIKINNLKIKIIYIYNFIFVIGKLPVEIIKINN